MDVPKPTPEMMASFPPEAVALIQALFAKIAELEERLNKHSGNSSRPPSSDPPSVKRAPPKPASGKNPGGQPGHPKQTRELIPSENCDTRLDHFPKQCKKCASPLTGVDPDPERFQVSELPVVRPVVTEHRLHRLACACGCVTRGELPATVSGQDGPRLKSAVVLLTGQYRLSKKKTSKLLTDLFGVSMSASQVCAIEAEVGEALQPVVDEVLAAARRLPANVDETSMGKKRWLWAMVTAVGTVFQIASGRTRGDLTRLVGTEYSRILTSDRHSLYSHLAGGNHQYCWAHLRRDFQAMIDRHNPGSATGRELLKLSDELFLLWRRVRDGTLDRGAFAGKMSHAGPFRTALHAALERGVGCGCAKTAGTCKQLLEREVSLFRFAFNAGVEPTNNAAERAIRHGVIWRKQSHGPQSESGARYLANIWSIVETCRQQGRRTWEFLTDCLRGTSEGGELPSLVSPMVSTQAA